jgi:hypothetical protein
MAEFDHGVKEIADTTGRLLARLSKRVHLPTVCVAVVLQPRGFRTLNGTFHLQAVGEATQHLRIREVCLWQLTPEPWWEEQPGLMALYPLCHHGKQPRAAIQHAAAAIERKLTGTGELANGLYLLHVFGGLAYSRLDVAGIIGREKMKISQYGQELREEGRLEARRADILAILEERFGASAGGQFEAPLNAIADFDRLGGLLRLAGAASDLGSFRDALTSTAAKS